MFKAMMDGSCDDSFKYAHNHWSSHIIIKITSQEKDRAADTLSGGLLQKEDTSK